MYSEIRESYHADINGDLTQDSIAQWPAFWKSRITFSSSFKLMRSPGHRLISLVIAIGFDSQMCVVYCRIEHLCWASYIMNMYSSFATVGRCRSTMFVRPTILFIYSLNFPRMWKVPRITSRFLNVTVWTRGTFRWNPKSFFDRRILHNVTCSFTTCPRIF